MKPLSTSIVLRRESGGIGRRAGFRILWGNTRGGSSPPFRILFIRTFSKLLVGEITRDTNVLIHAARGRPLGVRAAAGAKLADVCRRHEIIEATFYAWRAKFGGMYGNDAQR